MANLPPPPPYSETDIYSNPSSRSPRVPGTYPPSSAQTDSASVASSVLYTPPYTPAEEADNQLDPTPAQLYFESRPVSYRAVGQTYNHEITVNSECSYDDFPYDVSFADRDITTQDWATFVNFLIPQHIDARNAAVASEKMKAELLDERMRRLTLDGEKQERDMSAVDAQLGVLAPHRDSSSGEADVASVLREWNVGFFEPRGVRIIARLNDHPDPPVVLPDEISLYRRRTSSASSSVSQSGPPPLPTRPTFWDGRRAPASNDIGTARRGARPRNWGWGPHGPEHVNISCRGVQRGSSEWGGHDRHCSSRGYRTGDNADENGDCRRCGPRRAQTDVSAIPSSVPGEFASYPGKHFRFGKVTGDESEIRIGNALRVNSEGLQVGNLFVGKRPPSANGDDVSDATSASEESEGSLPDLDELRPAQYPILRQSLMDWLNHPDHPVTKEEMRTVKAELEAVKSNGKAPELEGNVLKELKVELKAMKRAFREAKKARRLAAKDNRKLKKTKKREARRARKQKRVDGKIAAKREAKGKGKVNDGNCDHENDASELEAQAPLSESQQGGFQEFVSPPTSGFNPFGAGGRGPMSGFTAFGRGRGSAWASMGTQPYASPVPPNMPPIPTMPGAFSRHRSIPGESSSSSRSDLNDLHVNLTYLRSEAARQMSEAAALRVSAKSMKREAHEGFDEKTRLTMNYAAADLETEAKRLAEDADRLTAEALQLEENALQMKEDERIRVAGEGRSYLRRMRETGGVSV